MITRNDSDTPGAFRTCLVNNVKHELPSALRLLRRPLDPLSCIGLPTKPRILEYQKNWGEENTRRDDALTAESAGGFATAVSAGFVDAASELMLKKIR